MNRATTWLARVCVGFCVSAFAHTEKEAVQMVERGLVNLDRLVVKIADDGRSNCHDPLGRVFRGRVVEPLFSRSAEEYRAERQELAYFGRENLPKLELYRLVRGAADQSRAEAIETLHSLFTTPGIEFAYFEPKSENAVLKSAEPLVSAETSDRGTGDYEANQFHLDAAPRGVDAKFMWNVPGGTGEHVRIIDIEYGWETRHEDFRPPFWVANGSLHIDHGTAVWGEVAAKRDGQGVTGIAHDATFGVQAYTSPSDYDRAARNLGVGDVMIIEQHQYGPDGSKFAPMEYWQANFDALRLISAKGIIIVAAGGNGNSNLDSPNYGRAFDLSFRDSGAILVGAGAAPGQYHLRRLNFSNYGSRVDAFAYGNNVVTTGYGDLFNGGINRRYTYQFSGTSSATPIVAGAVAALQSASKARGRVLSPREVRDALRNTGSPQVGAAGRIGNLPDLKALARHFQLVTP